MKKMKGRSHTFDSYREEHIKIKLQVIRKAINIIGNSVYPNITKLAKDISKLVYEIELNNWEKKAQDESYKEPKPKPQSYTTLLRNHNYKILLSLHLEGNTLKVRQPSVSDIEIVKMKCAHLESQNEMLKNRLSALDLGGSHDASDRDTNKLKELEILKEDKTLLVQIINSIMRVASDIFIVKDGKLYAYNDEIIIDEKMFKKYESMTQLF